MIIALLALQYALPLDTMALKQAANEARVPVAVVYAVKYMETRVGRAERALGPGREVCDPMCHRVCREIGPMQVNPCIHFDLPGCNALKVYAQNLTCGAGILRFHYERTCSWQKAIEKYNGSGYQARIYVSKALEYIGYLTLVHGDVLCMNCNWATRFGDPCPHTLDG